MLVKKAAVHKYSPTGLPKLHVASKTNTEREKFPHILLSDGSIVSDVLKH